MMAKHSISIFFLTLLLFYSSFVSGQCWKSDQLPEGFKINKVYALDSLIVSEKIYDVLDHSIALVDSFSVNKNETWLFFVISFYSKYDSILGNQVRIELKQGTSYDVFELHSYFYQLEHFGAFCYKGFTFFVLNQHKDSLLVNELFEAGEQEDFPVYYKKPEISEKWEGIDYTYTEKYIYVFFRYKNGALKYVATRPFY